MYWTEFLTIAIAHLFAVASPGPDFAVVMRQSVTAGTRAGIWTSLGVGAAILLHVAYCLFGVAIILSQSPALFGGVKIVAAIYLFYIGVQALRKSFSHEAIVNEGNEEISITPRRAFVLGFLTNGLNPKATLFFLALFTVGIDINTPVQIQLLYGMYLALATFAWFTMLSLILGHQSVRAFMAKSGAWFERIMGIILIFLAVQIALVA